MLIFFFMNNIVNMIINSLLDILVYLFIYLSQNARIHVLIIPGTYFRNGEKVGRRTGKPVKIREVTLFLLKPKKNGTLSMMKFKNVPLGILVRGTLVYARKTQFGLGGVENN